MDGCEIPKPFVLRADMNEDDLILTLRPFGRASNWAGDFHAALIGAGRRGAGFGDTDAPARPTRPRQRWDEGR